MLIVDVPFSQGSLPFPALKCLRGLDKAGSLIPGVDLADDGQSDVTPPARIHSTSAPRGETIVFPLADPDDGKGTAYSTNPSEFSFGS